MKLGLTLAHLIFLSLMLAGCSTTVPAPRGFPGVFGLDYYNGTNHDYLITYAFSGSGESGLHNFPSHDGAKGSGFDCGPRISPPTPQPSFIRVTLREPHGNKLVDGRLVGPVVFVGNWTGVECEHTYVFRLIDPDFTVEVYEEERLLEKKWPCCDREYTKRGKDLERVPP